MSSYIQLPKICHPGFQSPKVKPIGVLEINRRDTLSRNIEGCFLWPDRKNLAGTFNADSVDSPVPAGTINGSCYRFSSSTSEYLSAGTTNFNTGIDDFTTISVIKSSASGDMTLISKSEASGVDNRWASSIEDSAGEGHVRCIFDAGTAVDINGGIDVLNGDLQVVSMVTERSGSLRGYAAGTEQVSADISGSSAVNVDSTHALLFGHFNDGGGGQGGNIPPIDGFSPYEGDMYASYLQRRAVNVAEQRALGMEPYRFIQPTMPVQSFVPDAVVAAGNLLLTNRSIANYQGMRQ